MKVRKILSIILSFALLFGVVYVATPTASAIMKYDEYTTETNVGNLNMAPWNNEDIRVRLASGAWADPVVIDYNDDGYLDLLVSGSAVVYNGTLIFYGGPDSTNPESDDYLHMDKGRYVMTGQAYMGGTYIYDEDGNYEKTVITVDNRVMLDVKTKRSFDFDLEKLALPSRIDGNDATNITRSQHIFVDIDSDGKMDLVRSASSWTEYGWNGKFDSEGNWGTGDKDVDRDGDGDPLHGWVAWARNTSDQSMTADATYGEVQVIKTLEDDGSHKAIDVYGYPTARFWDLDNDGDLDIVCGSFNDYATYFENISDVKGSNLNSSGEFLCAKGRVLKAADGDKTSGLEELHMEQCIIRLTSFDWNRDGKTDLIVGEEDGSVSLYENTGLFDEIGAPIFETAKYFTTDADSLKVGILNTPFSIDWDGDGDEDIITGESSGFYTYLENITPKGGDLTNPSWAAPIRMTNQDGEVIRRMAGPNGSVQGPAESKLGYTVPTVADWDNDGTLDLVCNDIWGKILWYRGIPGETTKLEDARAVEVEWENGVKYPSYNWWVPEGNNLVTYWRTTAWAQDLNGDGLCDLTVCDHEGYMAFFERYEENGVLKLKEGKRIFYDSDGGLIRLAYATGLDGGNNRSKFCLVDWNGDGKLDLIRNDAVSACYFANIAENEGEYKFEKVRTMYNRTIAYHTSCPAVCDWNGDGKPDLLVGAEDGHFYYLHRDFADTETVGEKLREHLVASYDFEGTTPLADKANKGETKDNLSVLNPDKVEIKNGVAKIRGNGALSAAHSSDILSDEMTIFFKAKLSGNIADSPVLISKGDSSLDSESRAYDIFANYNKLVASITARNDGVNFNNYELSSGHASIGAATLTDSEMKGENAMPALGGAFKKNKDSYPTLAVFSKTEEEGGEDTETETGSDVWSATGAVSAPTKGTGTTEGDPILIETAEQLAYVIKNGGGDGLFYQLEKDIYLNDIDKINWQTGEVDSSYTLRTWYTAAGTEDFKGTIDGNGHTVYGMYLNAKPSSYSTGYAVSSGTGLIPTAAGGNFTVKNLGIDNAYLNYGSNTGGLVGTVAGTVPVIKVQNCFVGDDVSITGANAAAFVSMTVHTGSLADQGVIEVSNCFSRANITNKTGATGLIGTTWVNSSTITIRNCYNSKGAIATTKSINSSNNYALEGSGDSNNATLISADNMKGADVLSNGAKMSSLGGNFVAMGDGMYPELRTFVKVPVTEETELDIWDGPSATSKPTKGGDGSSAEKAIIIETPEQFAYVFKNGGGDGVYYRLEADIYLNDPAKINWATGERTDDNYTIRRWYTRSDATAFAGHIDGNGHIVYGLYAVESLGGYFEHATVGGGLVSRIDPGKAVSFKNIGIENAFVDNGCNTGAFIGIMTGEGSSAKFDRCFVGEAVTVIGQNAAAFVGATTTGSPKINISNSYSLATLVNKGAANSYTGLVGDSWSGDVNVSNSYNAKGPIYLKNAYPHEDVATCRSSEDLTVGAWREYAFVVKRGNDGYLDTYLYVSNAESTDSEDDYILLSSVTNMRITHINESTADLIIGNNSLLEEFAAERAFDHIAIYDTAFSPAELMGVLPYDQNNNLVAKWNFNGQTDEDRLADTAFGGDTSDNLTLAGDSGVIRFEDGQAIISGNGALFANDSEDLSQTTAMTVYFRVKLSGTLQDFGFIEKRSFAGAEPWGNSRAFCILNYPNGKYSVQTNTDNLSISSTAPEVDVWREVAFIIEKQDTGKVMQSLYVSTVENPTAAADFVKVCTSTVSGNGLNDTDVPLYIGNDISLKSKTVTRSYDEVRIYSATLGLKEVADIVPDEEIKPSHLVAKWTLSGEDDVILNDTADEGTVDDNLTIVGKEGNVTFSKGVAKITGDGALQAADSVDLSQTENMTLFFRMKLEGEVQDFSFADKRSFPGSAYGDSRSYGVFYYSNQIGAATNSTGYYTGKRAETDQWREYALVITKTSDTTLNQTLYRSTVENPTKDSDFTAIANQTVQSGSINDTAVPLLIGNDSHMKDRSFTRYVDEVRLYDTNLSKSQIAAIEIEQSCTRAELSDLVGQVEYAKDIADADAAKMGAFKDELASVKAHISSGSNDTLLGAELYASLETAYKALLILGDVNASGKADIADVVYLNFVIREEAELKHLVVSDLNGDGITDTKDLAYLRLLLIK